MGVLLFFFVPETFWDRTPTRKPSKRPSFLRRLSSRYYSRKLPIPPPIPQSTERPHSPGAEERNQNLHVGFAAADSHQASEAPEAPEAPEVASPATAHTHKNLHVGFTETPDVEKQDEIRPSTPDPKHDDPHATSQPDPVTPAWATPAAAVEGSFLSPNDARIQSPNEDYFNSRPQPERHDSVSTASIQVGSGKVYPYTRNLRKQPALSFVQQLKPYHGRLNSDKWIKVMARPFVLFAYPAVLWSAVIYACSIGWLIVISETMAIIYRDPDTYNFGALQTGLVYISPFIGGILGTGVAGKISDVVVKAMSRRNGGLYEPEFRLVMAIPILITTCIGLMGFGWSAEQKDHWIVPTVFFGVVSFGCSLGSTTSITFCVDSYRQYAGEALVTLNFAKNILHGLVFSLFVSHWLADDGPKMVYIWIGIIQLILLIFTVPLFIYGKRLRMWTVRRNLMEKF